MYRVTGVFVVRDEGFPNPHPTATLSNEPCQAVGPYRASSPPSDQARGARMRKRAAFGAKPVAVVFGLLVALAVAPATASAVTSVYHPDPPSRTFGNNQHGWSGSAAYGPGCVQGATCPAITNGFQGGGGADGPGDGFIRTSASGLAALGGATSTGIWTSPKFTYVGAHGVNPTTVAFTMATQGSIGGVLDSGGSVTFSVVLADEAGGSVSLIPVTAVPTNGSWSGVPPVSVSPNALQLGHEYRFRVSAVYSSGLALLPSARVDYDNIALVAEAPGGGAGIGGGVAGGGLASKTVVMKGDKLKLKVRCGRAVQGRCKIKMVGLWKKAGPRVTKLKKVFVRHGKTKKVALKLRPRAIAAVATRDDIWIAIKVNANGFKTLKIKKLNLKVQN
jgi:hypothetical protein